MFSFVKKQLGSSSIQIMSIHISIAFLFDKCLCCWIKTIITMPLREIKFQKGPRICMIGHDSSSLSSGKTLDFSSPVGWTFCDGKKNAVVYGDAPCLCTDRTIGKQQIR